METPSHFGIADYLVFSLLLIASIIIGVYYRFTGGKQQTNREYLMADKNMHVFPVTCSLLATYMSGIALLGLPREIYVFGTQWAIISIGYIFGNFFITFFYLPVFFKLQNISAYEYLEMRFGKPARIMVSATFIIRRVLITSVSLYAPAIALNAVIGLSETTSILSVGLVCTFYSTIGGMKAILWADVLQAFLMFTTVLAVNIKGLKDSSFGEVWNIAATGGRIKFWDFNPNPTTRMTFWTQVLGGIAIYMSINGVNQLQVQRLLTVNSLRKSQLALFFNCLLMIFFSVTTSFAGLVIYSKYYDCDPLLSKRIMKSDQLLPLFIADFLSFSPGLAGFIFSGIFSATLSSISSVINSLAAVTLEDFLKPALKGWWQREDIQLYLANALACTFGFVCILLSFVMNSAGGLIEIAYTITGITGGPILGIFTLGMLCRRCTQRGAIISFVIGISFTSWMGFGAVITKPHNSILPTSIDGYQANPNEDKVIDATISFNNLSQELTDVQTLNPNEDKVIDATISFNNISQELTDVQTLNPNEDKVINATISFNNLSQELTDVQTLKPLILRGSNLTSSINKLDNANPSDRNENIFYIYRISFMLYGPIGFLIVVLFGILATLCDKQQHVNPDLLSPVCWKWYPNVKSPNKPQEKFILRSEGIKDTMHTFVPIITPVSLSDDDDQTKL